MDNRPVIPFNEWLEAPWDDGGAKCYMARRKLEIYWERVRDLLPEALSTHKDMRVHERVSASVRKRVLKAVAKYM